MYSYVSNKLMRDIAMEYNELYRVLNYVFEVMRLVITNSISVIIHCHVIVTCCKHQLNLCITVVMVWVHFEVRLIFWRKVEKDIVDVKVFQIKVNCWLCCESDLSRRSCCQDNLSWKTFEIDTPTCISRIGLKVFDPFSLEHRCM